MPDTPKRGRPSQYTDELANDICSQIATTHKGLKTLCDENSSWPEPRTIYRWLLENDNFCHNYARAKEDQTRVLEDEILQIADNTQIGEIVTLKGDGKDEIRRADMIDHRKLQIEARKWLMGKLKPAKYGDKFKAEVTGEGGGPLAIEFRSIVDEDK